MQIKNPKGGYSLFSRFLHWSTALLIIGMLALGIFMTDFVEKSPFMFTLYGYHKSFGVIALVLGFTRLAWHFISPPPMLLGTPTPKEKLAVVITHSSLIGLIMLIPLSGWLMSSSGGYPVKFFGLFTLPSLSEKNHDLHEITEFIHGYGAYFFIALIVLHVAAAAYHHRVKKDNTLKRMVSGKNQ